MNAQPNDLYAKPLWLGGGISWGALTVAEIALRGAAKVLEEGPIKVELNNLANAAAAELSRRPVAEPGDDLI